MSLACIRQLICEKRIHDALKEVDQALAAYPDNVWLWVMRGDLIQLVDSDPIPFLAEAERSYRKALELDSENLEAIESVAHYYDSVDENLTWAKQFAAKYIEISSKKCAEMNAIISETSWM